MLRNVISMFVCVPENAARAIQGVLPAYPPKQGDQSTKSANFKSFQLHFDTNEQQNIL